MSYIEIDTTLNLIADIMQDCKVTHKHRALNRNIKQIPTADVVEVVRCKDCIHCVSDDGDCLYCFKSAVVEGKEPDDYCSCGERKEKV